MLKQIYRSILKKYPQYDSKRSYSQNGEDILIKTIFDIRKINQISYLDIGANDPVKLNNTYLFYRSKSRGVNVDANPNLVASMNQMRPEDTNVNIGISREKGYLDFYIMENDKISTFSFEEYQNNLEMGLDLKEKVMVEVTTVDSIVSQYFDDKFPDFLNIDVEGLEWDILNSINFESSNTPKVICLETAEHNMKGNGNKREDIIQYVVSRDYHHYADTHFNSILVRKDFWHF